MSLAKKRTRKISVDGIGFRWKISRARHAACDLSWVYFAADLFDSPACRLVVKINGSDIGYPFFDQDFIVTPKTAEYLIRSSIGSGWNPKSNDSMEISKTTEELSPYITNHPLKKSG